MPISRLVTFFLLGCLIGGGIVEFALQRIADNLSPIDTLHTEAALISAAPTSLRIPAVGVETVFENPLGLDERGGMTVPESYETVGWYKHSPTPGELGPAVVLGHVDSVSGPAVFWDIKKLRKGDEIYIDREDGSTAVFLVTKLEHHTQGSFPTEKVYSDIDHAGLRLITCSGYYNHETLRYSHNLIVFAELVQPVLEKAG